MIQKGFPGCKVLHDYLLAAPYQAVPIPASEHDNMAQTISLSGGFMISKEL